MEEEAMLLAFSLWNEVGSADRDAFNLFSRHYSAYKYADGRQDDKSNCNRHRFTGPGQKLILMTADMDALFAWVKSRPHSNGQAGVYCSVFRNESQILSSTLILEAEKLAWQKWPGERLFTYVAPAKIRSRNPGCCFKKAGWRACGVTKKRGYVILEKLHDWSVQ
jgi:hypothetical protein